jgi:hypothetical protein
VTDDSFLEQFLGLSEQYPYVLLQTKDNVTNFDTYVWEPTEWNAVTPTGDMTIQEQIKTLRSTNIPPKIWSQPSGINAELNLTYAPETFNKTTVNIVLYYLNTTIAAPVAQLFVQSQQKYPTVNFYCWDLMIADAPQPLQYIPSVTIYNHQVHQDEIIEIQQPFNVNLFYQFIDANIGMIGFYDSLKKKKRKNPSKDTLINMENQKKELQQMLTQLKTVEQLYSI